jgi:hypothetical protein
VLVAGSLAIDQIMTFPGHFKDHIRPEKIHMISISFLVSEFRKQRGGCSGNIAYSLALLGEQPRILAAAGADFAEYRQWLIEQGIGVDEIAVYDDEVTASGWNLIRLFTSLNLEFNYDITARKKDQFVILTKNYLESNMGSSQELYIESIYPDTIFIKIENYEEKYVKLLPRINVNCMDGYQMVGQPVIEPDSIKIGGGVDVLKNLDFLFTHEQAFNNVNSSIIKNIGVTDSLSNIIWRSQNEIKLTVNVELTAEKEFTNIEIKVPNVPNDKEVLLIPQSISLQLKGGINQLSAVDASKLRVYIDYNSILNDTTGSLEPKIELPHGCIIISVKPDKIQYVIKNKSS